MYKYTFIHIEEKKNIKRRKSKKKANSGLKEKKGYRKERILRLNPDNYEHNIKNNVLNLSRFTDNAFNELRTKTMN